MNGWAKCTDAGKHPIFINLAQVRAMQRVTNGTRLWWSDGSTQMVLETPEEIANLAKQTWS